METHTGVKPLYCDVCGLVSSPNSNLKAHYQIHMKEKPYACEVCQLSFSPTLHGVVH